MRQAASLLCLALLVAACSKGEGDATPAAQASASRVKPAANGTRTPAPQTSGVAASLPLPDLAACRTIAAASNADLYRKRPLPVPPEFAGIMRTDMGRIAVSTLSGKTVCIDANWMEAIDADNVSAEGRFAQFHWSGDEAGGHIVVDRSGAGVSFDTGDRPVPSPSRRLVAALEYSESGFGSLNGFGVWQVSDSPMREVARLPVPEGLTDWRMHGWRGDACVPLSAVRFDDLAGDFAPGKEPRQYFVAAAGGKGWQIIPGEADACPAR